MIALFDCDGVVADFVSALLDAVGSDLTKEDIVEWDVLKFLTPVEKAKALESLKTYDFWVNLPIIDGARDGIEYVRFGYQVIWVTSPWLDAPQWAAARREWLRRNFQADPADVHIKKDKSGEEGDFFVDDKVSHVESWQVAHPAKKAFIFDQPYNQDVGLYPRFSWSRVKELL